MINNTNVIQKNIPINCPLEKVSANFMDFLKVFAIQGSLLDLDNKSVQKKIDGTHFEEIETNNGVEIITDYSLEVRQDGGTNILLTSKLNDSRNSFKRALE